MSLAVQKYIFNKGVADMGGQGLKMIVGTIDFDASYPTGGESLDLSTDIPGLLAVFIETKGGYVFEYDYTNKKVIAYNGPIAHTHVFTGSALATHAHDIKVKGAAAGGIDEPIGVEGTDTLAKDAATDRTILGADSATKGGVIAITAGTPAGTNATQPVAAAQQVADTTNLSAITGVRFLAVGF